MQRSRPDHSGMLEEIADEGPHSLAGMHATIQLLRDTVATTALLEGASS